MDKTILLLFLISVSFAVPACPSYPYKDYVAATAYKAPVKPADTLLQYCDWNLSEICILSNAFNTTDDKKLFIAESIANNSYDRIWQWDQGIKFGKYPPNTSKSSKNLKDAWVNLAYIKPSVYDNGTYLMTNTSTLLIKSNLTFVVDTRKLSGDCKDNFRICGYDYLITSKNSTSNINIIMNAKSEYLVDRYHLVTHCSISGCWTTCDYYRTDSFKDSITVSDSKKVNYIYFNVTSNYSILSYYNGLADLEINANNSNVLFQIGNSTFYKTDYLYKIRYEGPYNVLVKELIKANKTGAYGLSILERNNSKFELLGPYSSNCSLMITDHFNSKVLSGCNISNSTYVLGKPDVKPVQPKFFDSMLNVSLVGVAIYAFRPVLRAAMLYV